MTGPKIRQRPPKNSAAIARNATGAGMCMTPVKKPIVPLKPYPPNHPSIFWAPCAKKITPSTSRRMVVAKSLSVPISLRIMRIPSVAIAAPEWGQPSDKIIYPYIRILFLEINLESWGGRDSIGREKGRERLLGKQKLKGQGTRQGRGIPRKVL